MYDKKRTRYIYSIEIMFLVNLQHTILNRRPSPSSKEKELNMYIFEQFDFAEQLNT